MAASPYGGLAGTSFAPGEFRLESHHARLWADAVGTTADGEVFPGVAYLVAMRGGASIASVMELLEATPGLTLFGELGFEFERPLRTGCRYRVESELTAVERKQGRRRGPFDRVTLVYRLSETDSGALAACITQTWIVSRSGESG